MSSVNALPPPVFDGPVVKWSRLTEPLGLAVGDIVSADGNPDGNPDVAVVSNGEFNNFVAILRNTGVWSATSAGLESVPNSPFDVGGSGFGTTEKITLGDVDDDGDLDVVVTGGNGTFGGVAVLYNDHGTFGRIEFILATGIQIAEDVSVYDFDANGKSDILLSGSYMSGTQRPRAALLRKVDAGVYAETDYDMDAGTGGRGLTLTRGTVKLPGVPGRLDAVMGGLLNGPGGRFLDLFNTSGTGANFFTTVDQEGTAGTISIALGHFRTNANLADLAASVTGTREMHVWHANDIGGGQWRFQHAPATDEYSLPTGMSDIEGLDVGLLNGDGQQDIVAAFTSGGPGNPCDEGAVAIWLGQQTTEGTFRQSAYTFCSHIVVAKPRYVKVADMDQDGQQDVVVSNFHSGNIGVLLNRSLVPLP